MEISIILTCMTKNFGVSVFNERIFVIFSNEDLLIMTNQKETKAFHIDDSSNTYIGKYGPGH